MLFVKTKEQEKDYEVIFEVITRSPFNARDFKMEKETFNDLFKCSAENMINTNVSNEKRDIFECIDPNFIAKLYWWNSNISIIADLYHKTYHTKDIVGRLELSNYVKQYEQDMEENTFMFSKDFRTFKDLFNTAKECVNENKESCTT